MKKTQSKCPVKKTIDLIGNKWKLLIIQQLIVKDFRFGELKKAIHGISTKVLTENLRMLEKDNIIVRTEYNEKVLHVEYGLSDTGKLLLPLIKDMEKFGEKYKTK